MIKKAIVVISLFFAGTAWAGPSSAEPRIRVAVVNAADTLHLKISNGFEIFDSVTGKSVYKGLSLNVTVTPYAGGIAFGELKVPYSRVTVMTDAKEGFMLNSRRFRSDLLLTRKHNGLLQAVNRLPLEEYVKGVLYHEVSHYWPAEALKAQAIVCRTYALSQIYDSRSRDFDVTSDIYSQVYGGKSSERYRTTRAVDQTKGQVLTWNGKVFPAYFHATCGGHTENVSALWNLSLPPLQGVACGYCKESPHASWHDVVPLAELGRMLEHGKIKGAGQLKDIKVLARDESGRVQELLLITPEKEQRISGNAFRNAVDPNLIRSTNFTVEVAGKEAVFKGKGWGHGVGMCQWGAYFMAKEGKDSLSILGFYYPGAKIDTMRKGPQLT